MSGINKELRGPHGPLVVADRCVILQRVEQFVPADAEIVIPDVFFFELAQKKPLKEGPVFDAWVRKHADRLWVARFMRELEKEERASNQPVGQDRIIDLEATRKLRSSPKAGGFLWHNAITEDEDERRRAQFVGFCEQFSDLVNAEDPEWKTKFPDQAAQVDWIRNYNGIGEGVRLYNEQFRQPRWESVLKTFPDSLAVCRMARLMMWYALCFSLGKTRDFGNNFEDLEYALTASYVGRIATTDRGMKDAINAVFPACTVYDARITRA